MHVLTASVPLALGLLAPLSFGQDEVKLTGGDHPFEQHFGRAVALDGDTLVVGGRLHSTWGDAYVFVRDGAGWKRQARLVPDDALPHDAFGCSVAIDGDTLVIGAYRSSDASGEPVGAAYVYVREGSQWGLQAKLIASDAERDASMGWSVAIHEDTIVVGASGDGDLCCLRRGSVYVFVRSWSSWSEQQKIEPNLKANAHAGHSVAIDGDTLAFGAPRHPLEYQAFGRVLIYTRSGTTWTVQKKLKLEEFGFGWAVALDGDTCIVGSHRWQLPTPDRADVFVRVGTKWKKEATLRVCGSGEYFSRFGTSVALRGDLAVVGDPRSRDGDGTRSGSAHVFVRNATGWTLRERLTPGDGKDLDGFGEAVAISGRTVLVGAPKSDPFGYMDAGAAYVYEPVGSPFTTLCDPAPVHSGGVGAQVSAVENDASAQQVTHLECTDGPAGQFGLFLVSACSGGKSGGGPPGCLADPIGRYTGPGPLASLGRFDAAGVLQNVSGTSATGTGFDVPQSLPLSLGGTIQAGETWVFQAWFRDGAGSGSSSAVGVTFR